MDQDCDYVCSLAETSIQKAREELGEDPANRLGAVQTLRAWIKQQRHLKCPTGKRWMCFVEVYCVMVARTT